MLTLAYSAHHVSYVLKTQLAHIVLFLNVLFYVAVSCKNYKHIIWLTDK
jgi:hypothetical protein